MIILEIDEKSKARIHCNFISRNFILYFNFVFGVAFFIMKGKLWMQRIAAKNHSIVERKL